MNVTPTSAAAAAAYGQAAPPPPPPLTNTAKLLGVSPSQLSQDMQSGTTLTSLASQAGISSSSLLSSIESDLQANAPQGAPALSSTQLTTMATNIANGTRPAGGHHHHHHGGGISPTDPSDAGSTAQTNLSTLADALGTDPATLLSQLTSGQDLTSALSSPSQTGYGTPLAASITGGVTFDQYA